MTDQELELELNEAGTRLGDSSSSVNDLLGILDDGEAYAYLLNTLAPEHSSVSTLDTKDPTKRRTNYSKMREKLDYKRYISPKDIVDGSTNPNLAFVANIFHRSFLWQLMRFNMLQLLKNLRFHSQGQGKEMTDADILNWANNKVKSTVETHKWIASRIKAYRMVSSSSKLLSVVEPRVVNWSVVTKGEDDEEKKLNATYIISVARKLGCSIFLLPEDIIEVFCTKSSII
ncbi:hypothetical protein Syun_001071 [Stephania yunnanensis]|uniref:Calponin-homology (CH) domain-containing protein n=1 Tax=Stephania yunnanensis TaxID=152371 RepID=A0AAP0LDE9_9MAGN